MSYKYTSKFKTAHCDRYEVLRHFAKENRQKMTQAEIILWEEVRSKKLGITFRRQHPIGDYIVDFFAYQANLIVELDGKYHEKSLQEYDDKVRTIDLERFGFHVLRFSNDDVFNSLPEVLDKIKEKILLYTISKD